MKIKVLHQDIAHFKGDTIVVNLFEGVKNPGGATGAIDKVLKGIIRKLIAHNEITGKLGETVVLHTFGTIPADRVIVAGLGPAKDLTLEQIRKAAGAAALTAQRVKARKIGTIVHGAGIGGLDPNHSCQALIEGTLLALYTFPRYKKEETPLVQELTIVENDARRVRQYRRSSAGAETIAHCQNIARDFINEPANNLTPIKLHQKLKKTIQDLKLNKKITYTVLDKRTMKRKNMGALLSVSQGSANDPQFIVLHFKNSKKPLVCLIGKTVTFDSGGISIKPSSGMERMKGDMSGGAAVIGATLAAALLELKVNLMTIIPAVENMPSGAASRPGDVVRAMNGKTIEIISTDAEGRMTMADALCYAESKKAHSIVDIATLTGGCVVAFGDITAAVMGNDQRFINMLLNAAEHTGERYWQLPLFDEYKEQIKTPIADMKNSGGRKASAITAGLFLNMFVNNARWIHLDIAGKEIAEKTQFYTPIGGTGFGVRTLVELLKRVS